MAGPETGLYGGTVGHLQYAQRQSVSCCNVTDTDNAGLMDLINMTTPDRGVYADNLSAEMPLPFKKKKDNVGHEWDDCLS